MLAVGAVTIGVAAVAAWLIAGRILRPIRDVAETARSITDTDLSRRIPDRGGEGDELGDLVRTVSGMLDRVESAVSAQRRFTDDAGHELRRSPSCAVTSRCWTPRPRRCHIDSRSSTTGLERMNRMVSDLLLLARAGTAVIHPTPTDIGAPTGTSSARSPLSAIARSRLQSAAETTAVLDAQRMLQALLALADNACRYATPGTASIWVPGQNGWLTFWVSDTRTGDRRGRPDPHLRTLLAGQRRRQAIRQRRAWSGDRSGDRGGARRRDPVGQRPRSRRHLHHADPHQESDDPDPDR